MSTGAPSEIEALRAEVERLKRDVTLWQYQCQSAQAVLAAANPELGKLAEEQRILTHLDDRLATWDKSVSFRADPRFMRAYERGIRSGHLFGAMGAVQDIGIHWRVAIVCWAAWHAARLPGDFVECGVNTGIMSLAACEYVEFRRLPKTFWLFDTFCGIPTEQVNNEYIVNEWYPECFARAQQNFAAYPNVRLVRGKIPDTLSSVEIERVAYLSIDMNIEYPEREALAHFWPKLVPGGIVVFDDYGWLSHHRQKDSHDAFAASQGVEIFLLPTGQGLLIKS